MRVPAPSSPVRHMNNNVYIYPDYEGMTVLGTNAGIRPSADRVKVHDLYCCNRCCSRCEVPERATARSGTSVSGSHLMAAIGTMFGRA